MMREQEGDGGVGWRIYMMQNKEDLKQDCTHFNV
jgi:hypothetical protein